MYNNDYLSKKGGGKSIWLMFQCRRCMCGISYSDSHVYLHGIQTNTLLWYRSSSSEKLEWSIFRNMLTATFEIVFAIGNMERYYRYQCFNQRNVNSQFIVLSYSIHYIILFHSLYYIIQFIVLSYSIHCIILFNPLHYLIQFIVLSYPIHCIILLNSLYCLIHFIVLYYSIHCIILSNPLYYLIQFIVLSYSIHCIILFNPNIKSSD
jgi:hypothetical protein